MPCIMEANLHLRICPRGHRYAKTSDCPTCPICEQERRPETGFLGLLGAPARRALTRAGITTPAALAGLSETELLALHGMGPGSLPKLRQVLAAAGLSFKQA